MGDGQQLDRIIANMGIKSYVAPIPDEEIGRNMYRRGKPIRECRSDAQRAAWLREEMNGMFAYLKECEDAGLPSVSVFATL